MLDNGQNSSDPNYATLKNPIHLMRTQRTACIKSSKLRSTHHTMMMPMKSAIKNHNPNGFGLKNQTKNRISNNNNDNNHHQNDNNQNNNNNLIANTKPNISPMIWLLVSCWKLNLVINWLIDWLIPANQMRVGKRKNFILFFSEKFLRMFVFMVPFILLILIFFLSASKIQ